MPQSSSKPARKTMHSIKQCQLAVPTPQAALLKGSHQCLLMALYPAPNPRFPFLRFSSPRCVQFSGKLRSSSWIYSDAAWGQTTPCCPALDVISSPSVCLRQEHYCPTVAGDGLHR